MLRHMRRLAGRLSRRLGGRTAPPSSPIAWASLCSGGVVVALNGPVNPYGVRIAVRFDDGPPHDLTIGRVEPIGALQVAFAAIDAAEFVAPRRCRLRVTLGGFHADSDVRTGPGRFAGRLEGIRDYGLEGWVSPLFATAAPRVRLLVDGEPGDETPLDRYCRALTSAAAPGGWAGFRLLLPSGALDGQVHRIGVRAGDTDFDFGPWSAKPEFHIDAARPGRLAGWVFEPGAEDVPTTVRLVRRGVTQIEVETHTHPDVAKIYGRTWSGFVFSDHELDDGCDLIVGPEGTGVLLGHLGPTSTMLRREEARRLLLSDPAASRAPRAAIRAALVADRAVPDEGRSLFAPGRRPSVRPSDPDPSAPGTAASPPVCAIVPVYNGLDDLIRCLDSLIPQLERDRARAIVIDDASPNAAVGRYLAALQARAHPALTILSNPGNRGFIATVNRALSLLEPGEDALLLNSDAVLPPGALERLGRHCHARPGIASVTPLSSNATILSFPSVTRPNPPALGLHVDEIDAAFAAHGAAPVVLPTGIGFCMYLNRAALDEAGSLSEKWGRGYCEEVEWCLITRDLGWIHVGAADIFVLHEGSVSFTSATRLELMARNHAKLEELYPEYLSEVTAFGRADPLAGTREAVLGHLLSERLQRLTIHATHKLGGGTKRYVDDLRALPGGGGHAIAELTPLPGDTGRFVELSFTDGTALTLRYERLSPFLDALEAAGVEILLQFDSRLGFKSGFLAALLESGRRYVVMLHDFQWYCPRIHLTDERKFYCGEPPPAVCQICVASGLSHDFADQQRLIQSDLQTWLRFNRHFLAGASRLLAPSQDTADRYRRRFGLPEIAVLPHPEPQRNPVVHLTLPRAPDVPGLRVVVVGAIGPHKGFELLVGLAREAARAQAHFFLTVIGYTADDTQLTRFGNVAITGAYEPRNLRALLATADPDFVFLPSVWPETYSYVLSEVWDAGYRVVAFDFGAPAERIHAVGGGLLIAPTRDPVALLEMLTAARSTLHSIGPARRATARAQNLEAYHAQCFPASAAGTVAEDGAQLELAKDVSVLPTDPNRGV